MFSGVSSVKVPPREGSRHREDPTMELKISHTHTRSHLRLLNACAQCGDPMFIPEWSEHLDERRIRHLWTCDACGYRFETIVCFPERAA